MRCVAILIALCLRSLTGRRHVQEAKEVRRHVQEAKEVAALPATDFFPGGCPPGQQLSQMECIDIASALGGLKWRGAISSSGKPAGCLQLGKHRVHFNIHPTGKADRATQQSLAICLTAPRGTTTGARFSPALMRCEQGTAVLQTPVMTTSDYDAATGAIGSLYDRLDPKCNQTFCPQADWAGCILRAAGHDFMDFADGRGGSDGCLDMQDKHNGGLHACLFEGEFGMSINTAYQQFCTRISLADFMVLAGEAVMKKARDLVELNDPALNFKRDFKFGRRTAETCDFANGRLPLVEESCKAVENVFVDRLQLTWRETAALMGVHTLGRARPNNSGFSGWWSDAENNRKFNNDYFKSLINKGWMTEQLPTGNWQWKRTDSGLPRGHHEMMLDTDMCLAYAGTTKRKGSEDIKASVHDCCAWRTVGGDDKIDASNPFCGFTFSSVSERTQRSWCCEPIASKNDVPNAGTGGGAPDCGDISLPNGRAFSDVAEFAVDEGAWLSTFVLAWHKATERGQSGLKLLSN